MSSEGVSMTSRIIPFVAVPFEIARPCLQMRRRFRCVSTLVSIGLLLNACGSNEPSTSPSPVAPTPVAPTAPTGPLVTNVALSGVVTENGNPVENAAVEVQWSIACGGSCSASVGARTDAAGRYVIAQSIKGTDLRDGATLWV